MTPTSLERPSTPREYRPARRSGRGAGRYAVLLAFLVVVSLVGATFAGLVPGLSALAGTARSRDLGVVHDGGDLESALGKMTLTGGRLEATLSEEELSAYLSHVLADSSFRPSELQVRLLSDNRFEASARVLSDGREYPIYLRGKAELQDDRIVASLERARLAGLPLTSSQTQEMEGGIEQQLAAELEQGGRTNLQVLETVEGSIHLVGRPE